MVKNLVALTLLAVFIVLAGNASYGDTPSKRLSVNADLSYENRLVLRGVLVNPDGSIHPSVTIAHPSGVSLNWWACFDPTDVNGAKQKFTEHDLTLNYSLNKSRNTFDLGLIHYQFPTTALKKTTELYAVQSWSAPFSPWAGVYLDVDRDKGFYIRTGVSHSVRLAPKTEPITLVAKLGFGSPVYNKAHFGGTSSVRHFAINDFLVGASKTFKLSPHVNLTPSITYTTLIDKDLRKSKSDSDNLFFGVNLFVH